MNKYRAILFDLFGTVALFDHTKLPVFEWNGQTSRSTMGRLREIYEQKKLNISFERFFLALSAVSRELGEQRSRQMREFSSLHRFSQTLLRAGFAESPETLRLAEEFSLLHMDILAESMAVPVTHEEFLAQVQQRYATALVSNFDHGPTARRVLGSRASSHLHHIVVSDEHGWRKPHPQIFTDALSVLGVSPGEALFVGDSPQDDIVGAKTVGMDMAWVNASGVTLPDGVPQPDYIIRAIPELDKVLF
jgi:HAD superfamily hydrolase (TIGR01509 family)